MIKLNDYLGALIASVNQARVMADLESAKIAQAYAKDDLMKHFSIPRFRAQDVELDIPVAIDGFNEKPVKDYQPIDNRSFNSGSYTTMKNVAKVQAFSRKTSQMLNAEIAEGSRSLEQDLKANLAKEEAFQRYEKRMELAFEKAIKRDNVKVKDLKKTKTLLQQSLKEGLYNRIQPKETHQHLEDANVVVEATKLREIPSENIVRIKMKLFEDGMEWHTAEDADGKKQARLLPE